MVRVIQKNKLETIPAKTIKAITRSKTIKFFSLLGNSENGFCFLLIETAIVTVTIQSIAI